MSRATPNQQEAAAALEEAARQSAAVRGADRAFGPVLVAVAVCYLVVGIVVGVHPRGGSAFAVAALVIALLATAGGSLAWILRLRAYSRRGVLRFSFVLAAWTWWNAAVIGASVASGWWGSQEPGFHFTISALIASIPLFAAGGLISRR